MPFKEANMEFDASKYPVRIEYRDCHVFPQEFRNELTVDLETGHIITKKIKTAVNKVTIKNIEISENDTDVLRELVSIQKLNDYEQLPQSKKTDRGYRDGWHTKYRIVLKNDTAMTGSLSNIYKESPLEKVLNYLREHYPKIEMLRSL